MTFLILLPAFADTGSTCPNDTIQGGSWNGTSCHYQELSDSPLVFCETAALDLVECIDGSTVSQRGHIISSHAGEWHCDIDDSGSVVGGTLFSGPFCCDGETTHIATAGEFGGTCIGPQKPRPTSTATGCSNSHDISLTSLVVILLFWLSLLRQRRAE